MATGMLYSIMKELKNPVKLYASKPMLYVGKVFLFLISSI
jgi:hypothetical protein